MPYKRESTEQRILRAKREFDSYSDSVMLDEPVSAALHDESGITWRDRRLRGSRAGPEPVYLNGQVKYLVGELRAWRKRRLKTTNTDYHEARRRGREARAAKVKAKALLSL